MKLLVPEMSFIHLKIIDWYYQNPKLILFILHHGVNFRSLKSFVLQEATSHEISFETILKFWSKSSKKPVLRFYLNH